MHALDKDLNTYCCAFQKAFHCFMQAIYLGSRRDHTGDIDDKDSCHPSDEHQLFHLYYDFGHLLYTMCCPPMNMEAFKGTTDKAGMTDDGSKISLKHREPTQRDGFKLSLIMFSKALKEPIPDQLAWRLFLMIGKCYGKLQRPPHVRFVLAKRLNSLGSLTFALLYRRS